MPWHDPTQHLLQAIGPCAHRATRGGIDQLMLANKENKVLGIADKALADCGVGYKMG